MRFEDLHQKAVAVLEACKARGIKIATAESCTGGLIAAALTDVAGSSAVFERGFVTYSNEAKDEILGVPMDVIRANGAVSEPVVIAMAEGALSHARAGLSVAVTGIAGPTGGTPDKPVGLVFFGSARTGGEARAESQVFPGERAAVRLATAARALDLLLDRAGEAP